ncbi:MAG: hypothetical protein QOF22_2100 [Bradyrhizobium sp.]|jgi:hypothetical protein|nr:hypothetical protein [Bradyrhizobium sp.]
MRETEARGWIVQNSSSVLTRALRLAVIGLGVGVLGIVATAGAARAADDEDEKSFTDKIVDGIKASIRGTSIDDGKIEYRERSPLVVPPRLDLPPPDTSSKEVRAPNWPKDPDEGRRKATAAAKKKSTTSASSSGSGFDPFDPFKRDGSGGNSGSTVASTTAGTAPKPTSAASTADTATTAEPAPPSGPPRPDNPSAKDDPVYDQPGDLIKKNVIGSALGFNGFGFGGLFGSKKESATFQTEPTRETLTQPPAGYQTPSPNFAYGTEEKDWLTRELSRPSNPDKVNQEKP